MTHPSWTKRVWAVLLPLVAICSPVSAAVLEVAPVSVELTPGSTGATITVSNRSAERTSVQARAFAWSQNATEDNLVRTNDLVLSPPIFQLNPDEAQTVRLMLRRPPATGEASYRILLDELPSGEGQRAVQFALRLSLPVFAQAGATTSDLSWRLENLGDGTAEFRVLNRGTRHDRLVDLKLIAPSGGALKLEGLSTPYVLPGIERHWRVVSDGGVNFRHLAALRATGRSDSGPFDVSVPVSH